MTTPKSSHENSPDILEEFSNVINNLIAINRLTRNDIKPSSSVEQVDGQNDKQNSRNPKLDISIVTNGYHFMTLLAHCLGDLPKAERDSEHDPLASAKRVCLRGMLELEGHLPDLIKDENTKTIYADSLVIATRGIISHTPYPYAFKGKRYHVKGTPTLGHHISDFAGYYSGLEHYMTPSQQLTVDWVIGRAFAD